MKYLKSYFIIIFFLTSIFTANTFGKFIPLAPGTLSAPGSPVPINEISFRWNSVDDAVSYTVYISKKISDQYVLIHNSSDFLKITDTIYSVSNRIFEANASYRWNFRTTHTDGRQTYSDRLYFIAIDPEELGVAINLYPGEVRSPGNVIGNLTPRFTWSNVKKAERYNLLVFENINTKKLEVFNSDDLIQVTDTSFMIPDGELEYGKYYSWVIISHKGTRQTRSREFYFNTNLFSIPAPPTNISSNFNTSLSETDNILLRWNKVINARGYGVLISEIIDGARNIVINSEENGLVRDTNFIFPKEYFSKLKTFTVSIRTYGRAGWSKYSEPYILTSESNIQDIRPITISPGIYNKNAATIESYPDKFVWHKINEAAGYGLYISQKTHGENFKLVFSSESSGLISDTSISIPESILKKGNTYRWNVRANINNKWSSYSKRRYFKYGSTSSSDSLIILNPGSDELPGKEINTLNPSLKWRGLTDTDLYQIIIEKKSGNEYVKVFDTDKKKIQKTSYVLRERALENNSTYRWYIIAQSSKTQNDSSGYKYFRTNISNINTQGLISFDSDEPEEIFLSLKYANIVDKTIVAFYLNGEVYLPFNEVFTYLEIQNEIDYKNKLIQGFFLNESNKYLIDAKNSNYTINNQVVAIDSSDIIVTNFDFFLRRNLFSELFDIDFQVFLDQLSIKTFSKFDLPIYARFQRDKNYLSLKDHSKSTIPLIFDKERKPFSFGVFDYFINYNMNKFSSPQGSYNFGVGGELLYGEAVFNTRGIYTRSDLINSQADLSWRYTVDDSKYISQVSVGSLNFEGLEFSNFNGVKVTNNPVQPRRGYTTIKMFDNTEPNWTVELYLNNRLFDIVRADASGTFEFNLPMNYGTTLVELRHYGLAGEFRSEKKLYQTPFSFYQPEEFIYNLSLGKQRITNDNIANLTAGYGINDWLTSSIGIEYLKNSNSDKPVIFSSTSARIFESHLLNFSIAPNTFYRFAVNATYFNQSSFVIDYTRYFDKGVFNPAGFKHELSTGVFYPVRIINYQLNLRATYDYSETSFSIVNEYVLGLSGSLGSFNPFINYALSKVKTQSNFANQYIDFGFSYSLFAIPTFLTTLRGNLISVRSSYDLENSELEILSVNFSTNLSPISRLHLSHTYNFNFSEGSTQLQFQMYLPDFQYSAALSTEFLSQNFSGSIGYNRIINDYDFYQRNQLGKVTAIFRLFIDENANGNFDSDEELLKGAKIYLGTSVIEYDETGLIHARELSAHTRYDVSIHEAGIKNPLLVPKYKSFGIKTDADPFKIIDIPFYESGEIDGMVFNLINDYKNPIAGLQVIFTNLIDGSITTTSTFTNGSFYYFGLKPGKYQITINEKQLELLNLKPQKENYIIEVLPGQHADAQSEVSIQLIPR